jgi:hypothetical protein
LDHKSTNAAYDVTPLQNRIISWKHMDRLITSKSGGLWILRRVVACRPDLHSKVATWLIRVPWKYESSMSVDIVAQLFRDSPQEKAVKLLAAAYVERALRKAELPLLHDSKFTSVLEALKGMEAEYAPFQARTRNFADQEETLPWCCSFTQFQQLELERLQLEQQFFFESQWWEKQQLLSAYAREETASASTESFLPLSAAASETGDSVITTE